MGEYWIEPPPVIAPPITSQVIGATGVAVDQEGRLAEDVTCRHCAYNLRGLALDGHCPECDMAIEQTLHGFLLRFSDPAWLKRLRSGLTLLIVAIFAALVVGVLFGLGYAFAVGYMGEMPVLVGSVLLLLFGGLGCMQLIAYWRITSPEPSPIHEENPLSARHLARIGLMLAAGSGLLGLALDPGVYMMASTEGVDAPVKAAVAWALGLVESGSGLLGLFALFIYGRSIASRFPADKLAKSTRLVMWGYMIPTAGVAILQLVAGMYYNLDMSLAGLETALMVCQVVLGLPVLVFGIWGIVLLFMYRSRLKQALVLAEAGSNEQDSTN